MVDITREEFWNLECEQKKSHNFRKVNRTNTLLKIALISFGICTVANVALFYSFFKILNIL